MDDDRWIVIPNWRKFQHYKSRTAPWIKVYTELTSRGDFLDLTLAERGLLMTSWLLYCQSNGRLRVSRLRSMSRSRWFDVSLKSLSDAGFIQIVASKPLAQRREEKRREEGSLTRPVENRAGDELEEVSVIVDEAMLELARQWIADHTDDA